MSNLTKESSKNSNLLHAYNENIKIKFNANLIEPVLETDSTFLGQDHHLPHRPVIKDRKTTKVRMVYNVSSNATGPSLNDCLYPGPTLCESLFGVLLRFHINRIHLQYRESVSTIFFHLHDKDFVKFIGSKI